MNDFKLTLLPFLLFPALILAQHNNSELPTSINKDGVAPHESAILDVQSKDKGVLIPRMDFCDIEKIPNPAEGLMIFDTEYNCLRIYINNKWDCLYQKTEIGETEGNLTGWKHLDQYNESYHAGLELDGAGNIYILSELDDNFLAYLRKYNSKGDLLWEIDLSKNVLYMNDIEVSEEGEIWITGSRYGQSNIIIGDYVVNDDTFESFIAKLNTNGAVENFYKMSGADYNYNIELSTTGTLYYISRNGIFGKITPGGASDLIIDNNDGEYHNLAVSTGEYICTYVQPKLSIPPMITLKIFNSLGNLVASKTIESSNRLEILDICADNQNKFYVGLTFTDEYNYNSGVYGYPVNGSGTSILHLDHLLNTKKERSFEQIPQSYYVENDSDIDIDNQGNLYLTSYPDPNYAVGLYYKNATQIYVFDILNGNLNFQESIELPGLSRGIINVSPEGDYIFTLNTVYENAKIGNVLLNNDRTITAVIKFSRH